MSNLFVRILTGIVFIGVVVFCISYNEYTNAGLFLIFSTIGSIEFYKILEKNELSHNIKYGAFVNVWVYTILSLVFIEVIDFYWLALCIPMLVLLVGLIGGTKTVEVNPDSTTYHVLAAQVNYQIATPLILVPGTYGTQNRFDEMLATLKTTMPDLSVEKITVHTDGTLKVTGKIKKSSQHPVFVIAFEEAEDGIEAISQQAQWFQQVLHSILDFYDFETYNFVGHSNGGLVFTEYLENLQKVTDFY